MVSVEFLLSIIFSILPTLLGVSLLLSVWNVYSKNKKDRYTYDKLTDMIFSLNSIQLWKDLSTRDINTHETLYNITKNYDNDLEDIETIIFFMINGLNNRVFSYSVGRSLCEDCFKKYYWFCDQINARNVHYNYNRLIYAEIERFFYKNSKVFRD